MKITIEGLTLGLIERLTKDGYKVEITPGELYADITKETPIAASESIPEVGGYGGIG